MSLFEQFKQTLVANKKWQGTDTSIVPINAGYSLIQIVSGNDTINYIYKTKEHPQITRLQNTRLMKYTNQHRYAVLDENNLAVGYIYGTEHRATQDIQVLSLDNAPDLPMEAITEFHQAVLGISANVAHLTVSKCYTKYGETLTFQQYLEELQSAISGAIEHLTAMNYIKLITMIGLSLGNEIRQDQGEVPEVEESEDTDRPSGEEAGLTGEDA
jgi:hypothetical protein